MRPAAPVLLVNPGRRHDGARADAPTSGAAQFHRRLPGYAPTRVVDAPGLAAELGLAALTVKDESQPARPARRSRSSARRGRCTGCWSARLGHEPEWRDLDDLRAALAPLGPLTLVAATDGNHGRAVAHMARLLGYAAHDPRARRNRDGAHRRRSRARARRSRSSTAPTTTRSRASAALAADDVLVVSRHVVGGLHRGAAHRDRGLRDDLRRGRRAARGRATRGRRRADGRRRARRRGGRPLRGRARRSSWSNRCRPRAACARPRPASPVEVPGPHDSIMAGLNCGMVSVVAWPAVSAGVDVFVAVDDAAAEQAMRDLAGDRRGRGRDGRRRARGPARRRRRRASRSSRPARVLVLCTEGATDPVAYDRIVGHEP